MRVTLMILCFFLLLHKSNAQVSSVRHVRVNAVKAFVLERKKAAGFVASSNTGRTDIKGSLNTTPQIHWDIEADEDISLSYSNKVKLLFSFCLILPSLFQLFNKRAQRVYNIIPGFYGELSCRYILQHALRI